MEFGPGSADYKTLPIQLAWQKINYDVDLPQSPFARCKRSEDEPAKPKKKRILSDVNGSVEPGTMLAIMGPSGSGKTTMLNVLGGRLAGKHEGLVYFNGVPSTRRLIKRYSTFVPQEDVLVGTQRVREAVDFAAQMKLPKSVGEVERARLVDSIIEELGLKKVSNSLIGYTGSDAANSGLDRGLSGGERKRLSIACQLVTNPSLLFLDEPTTGLDSFSALSVVSTLNGLAQQGRTVIFTVHQPSAEIFEMLDQLLFLSRGRIQYLGSRETVVDYFADIGYSCPDWENPADYVLATISGAVDQEAGGAEAPTSDEGSTALAASFETKFKNSKAAQLTLPQQPPPPLSTEKLAGRPGFGAHVAHIAKRQLLNVIREPALLRAGLIQCLFIALLMGLTFLRQGTNQTGLNNRAGAVFFGCAYMMFAGLLIPFQIFPTERKILLQQTKEGLYSTSAYYLAKLLAEVPVFFINTGVFAILFYFLVNLRAEVGAFFIFLLILFLVFNAAFAFGVVLITILPDPAAALQLFPIIVVPLMIFSGYFLNSDNTPGYFVWIEHLVFFKYGLRASFNNEFQGVNFTCDADELVNTTLGNLCPTTSGDSLLRFFGFNKVPIYGDLLVMGGLILIQHMISMLILRRSAKQSSG